MHISVTLHMILLCYCKDSWVVFEISLSNIKVVLESCTTTTYCIFYLGKGSFGKNTLVILSGKVTMLDFYLKTTTKNHLSLSYVDVLSLALEIRVTHSTNPHLV